MSTNAAPRRKKGGLGGLLAIPPDPTKATEGQEAIPPPAPQSEATPARPVPGATLTPPRREPREKLTCAIPVSVMAGLDALMRRDGTRRYDEVTDALRAHLTARGINIEEG